MTLANIAEPEVATRVDAEASGSALLALLVARATLHAAPFLVALDTGGLELVPPALPGGQRNRALLKAFCPDTRRLVAFFYKRSQVPGSHDRYAYGACVMLETTPDPALIDSWLDWTVAGFDPEIRPVDLRRALPFDVPE